MSSGGDIPTSTALTIPYPEVRAGLLSEYNGVDDEVSWLVQAGAYLKAVWLREAKFMGNRPGLDEEATWHIWDEFTTKDIIALRTDARRALDRYVEAHTPTVEKPRRAMPHSLKIVGDFVVRSATGIAIFACVFGGAMILNWGVESAIVLKWAPDWIVPFAHLTEQVIWGVELLVLLYFLGLEVLNAILALSGRKGIGYVS